MDLGLEVIRIDIQVTKRIQHLISRIHQRGIWDQEPNLAGPPNDWGAPVLHQSLAADYPGARPGPGHEAPDPDCQFCSADLGSCWVHAHSHIPTQCAWPHLHPAGCSPNLCSGLLWYACRGSEFKCKQISNVCTLRTFCFFCIRLRPRVYCRRHFCHVNQGNHVDVLEFCAKFDHDLWQPQLFGVFQHHAEHRGKVSYRDPYTPERFFFVSKRFQISVCCRCTCMYLKLQRLFCVCILHLCCFHCCCWVAWVSRLQKC